MDFHKGFLIINCNSEENVAKTDDKSQLEKIKYS